MLQSGAPDLWMRCGTAWDERAVLPTSGPPDEMAHVNLKFPKMEVAAELEAIFILG